MSRVLVGLGSSTWMALDWLIIGLATAGAWLLLVTLGHNYGWLANPWLIAATTCCCVTLAGLVFGLYEQDTLVARSRIVVRSLLTVALGITLMFACVSLFFYGAASRWIGLVVGLVYVAAGIPMRILAHNVIGARPVRLLCIGAGESIRKVTGLLERQRTRHYTVVGHVPVARGVQRLVAGQTAAALRPRLRTEDELAFAHACPPLGPLEDLADLLEIHEIDEVVVAAELATDAAVGRAIAPCLEGRRRVTDQPTFVESLLGEVPAESISTDWLLRADLQRNANHETVSRVMDVIVALLGLVLTLPIWPLIGVLIRADSPGPVFYAQLRVGRGGRLFRILKFRTMRTDAEASGARWASHHDNRITRVGHFLRRSRLDELPQLLNILRGEMTLVGPRPERPEFVHGLEQLLPHYGLRHVVRPGLTGWAQIRYPYGASVADAQRKLCFDLYYLKHRSLEFDVAILMRTFGTFLMGAR
jgi:exopolysaccharide biosynthesis polyprenyl glycosylphosphotransferase